jgi:hypothetical protein
MGGYTKGLAEGAVMGFYTNQYIKRVINLINSPRIFDKSLARRQKWWPKWHPLLTVGAHNI